MKSQTNDFAFKIATVNGTGSTSANSLIMAIVVQVSRPARALLEKRTTIGQRSALCAESLRIVILSDVILSRSKDRTPVRGRSRPEAQRADM